MPLHVYAEFFHFDFLKIKRTFSSNSKFQTRNEKWYECYIKSHLLHLIYGGIAYKIIMFINVRNNQIEMNAYNSSF